MPGTLAQMVRSKYPGVYDDMNDQDLEAKVVAKFPGTYDDLPRTSSDTGRPDGSALGRFASNAWSVLNPATLATGVYNTARHPVETTKAVVGAQADQFRKAADDYRQGHYSEMVGHAAAGALPLIGPAAAEAGEQIGSGDVAGGLGKGAGLLAPLGVRPARQAARAAAPSALTATLAERLEAGAATRVADVMSPKVGPNKTRFGNLAEKVAPKLAADLAADGAPLSRGGFHAQVGAKLAEAEQALDAASAARNAKLVYHTKPIIAALKAKVGELTAQTVRSGRVTAGANVIPAPNAARAAQLQQAIGEIDALGPVADFESIRRIRQAYDGPAKAVYSPAVTADYIKAQGGKLGAADVTGVLREHLAKWDPQTAQANAQYSLYRTADDVLSATAEVERTRPKVGRQIIARMAGTILGHGAAGVPGAAAGYVAGPLVDSALSSGMTTQLKTAALMTKLATAIRAGNVGRVYSLTHEMRRLAPSAARATGRATEVARPPGTEPATP